VQHRCAAGVYRRACRKVQHFLTPFSPRATLRRQVYAAQEAIRREPVQFDNTAGVSYIYYALYAIETFRSLCLVLRRTKY